MSGAARVRVTIRGAVQGVGFRPFVHRLAHEMSLAGWVRNDARGVSIEAEGPRATLETFLERLLTEQPAHAVVHAIETTWLESGHGSTGSGAPPGFTILASPAGGARTTLLLPDLATCPRCLREVLDPADRRHRYPFANCTECGPRFTIVRDLPYDRPNTTMAGFTMCDACRREYEDPADRRFHAQPIACPACGPALVYEEPAGAPRAAGDDALRAAAAALVAGSIVAMKGLGGYQLMCDAARDDTVAALRLRKRRFAKPFAVMVADLAAARALCEVDDVAAAILASAEAPIVLLARRRDAAIAGGVAPGLPTLGVMLPTTPLHHLLLRAVGRPVVATSGNLSDEPIATRDDDARARLGGIADAFLLHDRPVERHVDDSVGMIACGGFTLLRRARGWAPLPVRLRRGGPVTLAVGAHLKNAVALAIGRDVFTSPHVGDLDTPEAFRAFERAALDLPRLYGVIPERIAHDLHPDYLSTQWARRAAGATPCIAVQHHHAHLAACLAEHAVDGQTLGVTWDGAGLGPDGTVWGGEFLLGDARGYRRVAHLAPFRLPGGDAVAREPRRAALAVLWELFGRELLDRTDLPCVASFTDRERATLGRMLEGRVHAPVTTSAGRLFDAFAALAGLRDRVDFEGQAAMELEHATDRAERGVYAMPVGPGATGDAPLVVDWRPALVAALEDRMRGAGVATIAARFHRGLVAAIASVAAAVGEPRVALTGGCFQNRLLLESAAERLAAAGHEVLLHRHVPANDGGVCVGQAAVAIAAAED